MTERNHTPSSKEVKAIVDLGKKCSKTAFPNPTREGCPDPARLRAMAYRDRHLTLEDLPISHVVRCSPCFQDYLRFRRMSLLIRGLQITAVSLVVLVALFTVVRFIDTHSNRGAPSISQQKRTEPQPTGSRPRLPVPRAPVPINVDLAAFSPTRGDEKQSPERSVHLPPKLLRVRFQMPVGFEPGEYVIQLKSSTGTVYVDARATGRIESGRTSFEVDFDLAAAPPGRFNLLIRPPGLSWRRFPVVVQ